MESSKSFLIRYADPDISDKLVFVEDDFAMELDFDYRVNHFSFRGDNHFFIN